MNNRPIKHLLVDLDGTLLGNNEFALTIDFFKRALGQLKKYGNLRRSIGTLFAINRSFGRPDSKLTNDKRAVQALSERIDVEPEQARQFLRDSLFEIFPKLEKHFYPIKGSRDFLEWAKSRYKMTLATNPVWPPEIIELRVKWAGIDPTIFGSMTHVRRMKACKPENQYYLEILEQENLRAEDCLLIGNEVKMDLPATQVGIRVFIVGTYSKMTHLKPPKAKAQAWRGNYEHLKDLLTQIGSI